MRFSTDFDGQLSRSFLSFATVRECTLLVVSDPPRPLTASDILEWLNVDARYQEPKRLKVDEDGLADTVENLVERLKTVGTGRGIDTSRTRPYVVAWSVASSKKIQRRVLCPRAVAKRLLWLIRLFGRTPPPFHSNRTTVNRFLLRTKSLETRIPCIEFHQSSLFNLFKLTYPGVDSYARTCGRKYANV